MKGGIRMSDKKQIVVFGGDQRTIIMMQHFATAGFHVSAIGFEEYPFHHAHIKRETVQSVSFQHADAIILPVGGTNEQGKVVAPYAHASLFLTKPLLQSLRDDTVIYTGVANDYLKKLCETINKEYVSLFERDDVAILNSIPTAEGTLQLAIEHTDHTIHQAHTVVLGFGRIGMTIARLFKAVGAHVAVAARTAEQKARIIEMGCTFISFQQLVQQIHSYSLCINTVPSTVITSDVIDQMNQHTCIIDVASSPGGVDSLYAKQSGIRVIHALGIPGKTAPTTAGHILADVLIDLIRE